MPWPLLARPCSGHGHVTSCSGSQVPRKNYAFGFWRLSVGSSVCAGSSKLNCMLLRREKEKFAQSETFSIILADVSPFVTSALESVSSGLYPPPLSIFHPPTHRRIYLRNLTFKLSKGIVDLYLPNISMSGGRVKIRRMCQERAIQHQT